ncbi:MULTISPECIES: hypothetical protein [Pectobacterium]|nr:MULTISPECIES: hypothetical protein [Pectobacterium]GKW40847.1 hypothetical protein PEC301879_07060 [Pectobacterium carotovorum subsp. carotovorum]
MTIGTGTAYRDANFTVTNHFNDYNGVSGHYAQSSNTPSPVIGARSSSDYWGSISQNIRRVSTSSEQVHKCESVGSPTGIRVPTLSASVDRETSSSPDLDKGGVASFFTSCFSCFKKDN